MDVGIGLLDILVVGLAFLAVVHLSVFADAAGTEFSETVLLLMNGVPCQQKLVMDYSACILHLI